MLQLQRASAGSGKTYMLAKKFIEYYITAKDENSGGKPRLRTERELRDALPKILAITFTNKATNEMKLRIVDKLHALSRWTPGDPLNSVDYLQEFVEKLDCSPEKIADTSGKALKILLTDYGDFKVSTIDSFFQTVLRTFAYEADLDDTYQVEIDSNYITQMGLDSTLDDIDTTDSSPEGRPWVLSLMEEKAESGKGWNIFQKLPKDTTIYGQILKASRNLDKEDYKEIREDLDRYFEEHPDFYHTFNELKKFYEAPVREAHSKMREAARKVRDAFREIALDMKVFGGQYLDSRVKNLSQNWAWDFNSEKEIKYKIPEFTRKGTQSRVFDPRKKENPYLNTAVEDQIEALAIEMYARFDEWRNEIRSDRMIRWRIYRQTMPYVGLLQSVRNNSRLFLTDSNTVELGETNSILNRIIGDDDAPFVYERLGSRLEHFLIDEFQDTSRLQWANLRPLLGESEGKGNDNLIIGDAKQSIYRFRNADPSLITSVVPREFSATVRECGTTPAENTNWRSSRRVVEFNNFFFRYFTRELGPEMEALYSNIIQPPHHKEDKGFVSVRLFQKKDKEDEIPVHFKEIPELIADMLRRGYRMKDIAVLVDTREQGGMIIDSIMAYNNERTPEERIEFISADSLKTGESAAVRSVISILEAINNGTRAELRPKEERKTKGVGDWSRLRADFSFFAMKHPDIPLSEQLTRFLEGEYDPDAIRDMLGEMSTTVLPALVENIIRNFIPPHNRDAEAPFLAALQDNVLDFCDNHSSDIASFLEWWDKKGQYFSISSPEGVDAVQVMTVHKSKGLEFRCVIVPYSKQTIAPISQHEREWLWVRPDLSEAEGIPAIPRLPVWSGKELLGTPHSDIYRNYLLQYMTDKVNMAYVAYTRAIDELYIFTPATFKNESLATGTGLIGEYLWNSASDAESIISTLVNSYPDGSPYIAEPRNFEVEEEEYLFTYGKLPTKEEVAATTAARNKRDDNDGNIPIGTYRISEKIPVILYNDPSDPQQDILPGEETQEVEEPEESEESRRHGELMHAIMELIVTESDLPRALLKMKTRGHISRVRMEALQKELSEAMESVAENGWFSEGQRIINERGIMAGGKLIRPDRIIIRPDKSAVIVDYKFGDHRNDKAYMRQVRRYCKALLESGVADRCEGYVWYVGMGEVLRIHNA